ncbi:hypothetical protein F443_03135 [Plasmopara halstedii]|uniref:VWFA domain-containing protein n=1 Tax=Plasmopara halstedii TaxID=4781 RepID=A0A0P1AUA6_PLAHL|nr:hypothetical protein F443_03135 [Plasmopara halstedii]CEG45844.1 hypothetical protein F443_03135 [Plasmopara halstedii]|eukprot:XP_024582213.1 hypothetical protein F443_03135 [Plasmopara halstedii]
MEAIGLNSQSVNGGSKFVGGKNLFRLLYFARETQCEEDNAKPVLDELEVMRLCCSFGMMPSINPKDFDFSVLHAREFDADFSRFLSHDLLEDSCLREVKLKGAFGMKTQISNALLDMKACSAETLVKLADAYDGIYCVKLNFEDSLDYHKQEKDVSGLFVFCWIRDELFQSQRLRDIPTFVLRFLTGITSDIICCTSPSDQDQIEAAMATSDECEDDALSSYSVSFHIEKQEDQSDSTSCATISSIDLKEPPEECINLCLLKGSYPAISFLKIVKSMTHRQQISRTYRGKEQSKFAEWLKAESQKFRIELNRGIIRAPKVCESILRAFDSWPEDEIERSRKSQEIEKQEYLDTAFKELEKEIADQRAAVKHAEALMFRFFADNAAGECSKSASLQIAYSDYNAFLKWTLSTRHRSMNKMLEATLNLPLNLRAVKATLYALFCSGKNSELIRIVNMCATSSHSDIMKTISMQKAEKKNSMMEIDDNESKWEQFSKTISAPLEKLQAKWLIAVDSVFAEARSTKLDELKKTTRKSQNDREKRIMECRLDQLIDKLRSKDGLSISVSASNTGKAIVCKAVKEVISPPSVCQDIVKLASQGDGLVNIEGQEHLGQHRVSPDDKLVATFTVKVRSAIIVCTGRGRVYVRFIDFFPSTNSEKSSRVNETIVDTFGKVPSLCDYDARTRLITFVHNDCVSVYKFNETFKKMELMKVVNLSMRSTLVDLPFTDVLLLNDTLYITDSSGHSQGIGLHNDQTSNVMSVHDDIDKQVECSKLLGLADNLALGVISYTQIDDGLFTGVLECISHDNHRRLPLLRLGINFLTHHVSVQIVDDGLLVLDPIARKLYLFTIHVTVRSDSYRLRRCDMRENDGSGRGAISPRKQHWIYTFYHVFEKFPVHGLLEIGKPPAILILVACPGVEDINAALQIYHDFLSLLMSDLMALNKPLYGLDLTSGFGVQLSLEGVKMGLIPLKSFFKKVITFLPVQICRAEGNALTILHDGTDLLFEEEDTLAWEAADIAESIRFGLLSPLLYAWQGRCVVITSMGKQSTGKSYFLNHLTGSSFAIAGNRCTHGAWMTLRIMQDFLLVVLDFEGLGSFERTDQEDVFLSVLNASLSNFTIFRMEMRFDKDIECSLYMSVKDININDCDGVLSEFNQKFQKTLTANRENSFLSEMYSGKLEINCSPPLGSLGYYESLRRARQLVTKLVTESDAFHGYESGSSFHDCIRLVLAKISILDWTAVDESSQQLQMNELYRKIPGAIRSGCLIPVEAQLKEENLPKGLKDVLLHNKSDLCLLGLEQLSCDYPEISKNWAIVNQIFSLDEIDDESVDFGPAVCFHEDVRTSCIHSSLSALFQRYLSLRGSFGKITEKDYINFDAMLSFLVCRRKIKAMLWVKQFLGSERFMDKWFQIEQAFILPFEALTKRCQHCCTKCHLQCMRSACHLYNDAHDCGMDHVCRNLCEYCCRLEKEDMPRCVGKAGHPGICDCVKGDHTCGKQCSLFGSFNCGGYCALLGGHVGNHRCSAKQHACGKTCSAIECHGQCILNTECHHTVHKCAEIRCRRMCEVLGCNERCSTTNHFHGQSDVEVKFADETGQTRDTVEKSEKIVHLCDMRHRCNENCQAKGICNKSVQVSMKKFSGSCDNFDFELKQMVGVRNKCAIILQPGVTNHDGIAHSCSKLLPDGSSSVHGCDVRCEACEYYCEKNIGHEGVHSAAHGSMRNMQFVAEDDIIHWSTHTYVPGEKGIAEMCNVYCSTAGRGHVHYVKCDKMNAFDCVYTGLHDQRRHCKTKLKPILMHEVDELLHETYWKTIGWEDPCRSALEREHFAKCPNFCDAAEHKGADKSPGHRFACSHVSSTGKLHHVLVLDCSGSMRGRPWQNLISGVREYLQSRLSAGETEDIVSAVTFGNRGIIEFEGFPIEQAPIQHIEFHGGGTFYSNGLSEASAVFSRSDLKNYKPVMIFFTDGRPADRKKGPALAVDVRDRFAKFGLRTFVVGYGRASDLGLCDLAQKLGGSVHEALSSADLTGAFRSISILLGARAGLVHTFDAKDDKAK